MEETSDPLDNLLAAFEEVGDVGNKSKVLKETNIFDKENNLCKKAILEEKKSVVHTGDTDSSEDEDSRNWEEAKYSSSGRELKKVLSSSSGEGSSRKSHLSTWKSPPKFLKNKESILSKFNPNIKKDTEGLKSNVDVFTDPIFGLRIINPLISSITLKERMLGRQAVNFNGLNRFLDIKSKDCDWVLAGVIVSKTDQKTSQKGNQFSIWTLSDLKDDIKTVTLFLFSGANKSLWKTVVGTVVGILNPDVLEKKNDGNEATLSINNAQKVMIFGQSKDFGTCKSVKKNGDKCRSIVNLNRCEYCVYHIKQEYQKCTIRSDLQSTFNGRGLTALRNKVLGKNEVFYAGKSYTAIPAKTSRKMQQKDNKILDNLSGRDGCNNLVRNVPKVKKKKQATNLEITHAQRIKDLETIRKLSGINDLEQKTDFKALHSDEITVKDAKNLATSVIDKLKVKQLNTEKLNQDPFGSDKYKAKAPILSGFNTGLVDLNQPFDVKKRQKAKLNAIELVKKLGPIKKADPNSLRGSGLKRPLDLDSKDEPEAKKSNSFTSERFKKIMAASSSHQDLIKSRDDEQQDKYFDKAATKEKMEEKMINTHKIACKIIKCIQCKYTHFSASDLCKSEKHTLKIIDGFKRFFKCDNCKNRTVCLEVFPVKPCGNCGGSKWVKAGMINEKIVTGTHVLSITGGDQEHLNSHVTNANLDLLVPD